MPLDHESGHGSLHELDARGCVVNCPLETPECPPCAEGESCSLMAQSCESCAKTICVPDTPVGGSGPKDSNDEGSGTNAGAIAGGVVGGLAFLIALALGWWFYTRRRRQQTDNLEQWPEGAEKRDNLTDQQRAQRSRVGSMASTVLTRASNVIQIAYIPGVTNRSPPDSPAVLVPPVPPIPSAAGGSSPNYDQDQHYFLPGDIRDSVWSEMTEDQRKSISPSLARSSVATTIYRNNAIVSPVPAQQALRAKPAMVSVKSAQTSPASTPRTQTPAVPAITDSQLDKAHAVGEKLENNKPPNALGISSIVARSGVAKPVNVTKPNGKATAVKGGNGKSVPTVTVDNASDSESTSGGGKRASSQETQQQSVPASDKEKRRESSQSATGTVIEDSPAWKQSPFADPKSRPDAQVRFSGTSSAIPEEMSKNPSPQSVDSNNGSSHRHRNSHGSGRLSRASLPPSASGDPDPTKRSASPFSDENEVKGPR